MSMTQRSDQWRKARLGAVTASRFADVLTMPRAKAAREAGEWSQTAISYMRMLRAERWRCQPFDMVNTTATRWGNEWEAEAFRQAKPIIEERLGETLKLPVGDFAYIHHYCESNIGCSPDGIIGAYGLWEGKCPYNPVVHDVTVDRGVIPKEHIPQVQGSLWCTRRQFYVFTSFDPRMEASGISPLFLIRVDRDNDYIDNVLAPKVIAFRDYLQAEYDKRVGKDLF